MTVKYGKATELTPDARNANRGTERGLAALDKSLRTYGAGRSILVDKHGRIIAGNKTHQAAVDVGLDDVLIVETDGKQLVAVKRTDLDLETDPAARELAYADNRIGELDLTWDPAQLFADIEAGVNLDGMFAENELADILGDLLKPAADAEPQIDKAAELQAKWQTATGDLWALGSHRLACGDCTDKAVVERLMGGEKAALMVTDPPYGVSYADKNKFLNTIARGNRIQEPIDGDHQTPEEMSSLWVAAFGCVRQFVSEGACYYVTGPQGGDLLLLLLLLALRDTGWPLRHMLIWAKNNHVLGRSDYNYKHEPIIYGWVEGSHKWYGGHEVSLWEIDKPTKSDLHPTTKPVELYVRAIRNSSKAGGLVLDPFCGSGTVIAACENLGRHARCCEIDAGYCAVSIQRWVDVSGGTPERIESA